MKRFIWVALFSILLCLNAASLLRAADLQPEIEYPQKLLTASQVIINRITLARPGALTVRLQHQEPLAGTPWKVRLSDAQLQSLYEFSISGEDLETIAPRLRLPAGSYDLRLTAGADFSGEPLILSYSFEDESDMSVEREPNGLTTTATVLEPDKFTLGNTQSPEDFDIFALDIDTAGMLVLQLEANRSADGQHWGARLRFENQEIQDLDLDTELHCTAALKVSPGRYYIYVSAMETSWSDADYRLIARLQRASTVAAEANILTVGKASEGRLAQDERSQVYQVTFEGSALADDTLALRLHGREDELQELELELTGRDEALIWQGRAATNAVLYTALISGLEQGDYQLTARMSEESAREEIAYELGLFSPEMLTTVIEMQIGETMMMFNDELREIDPGFTTVPSVEEGRTLLPIRSMVESFGGTIKWEEASEQIRIDCGGHVINLKIGVAEATVDGIVMPLDVAPHILEGRTMLPLRFIGEVLGCFVRWQGENQSITIWY